MGLAVLAVPPAALFVLAAVGIGAGAALQRCLVRWPGLHRHSVIAGSLCTLALTGLIGALGQSAAVILGLLLAGGLPLLVVHERPRQPEGPTGRSAVVTAPALPEPLTHADAEDEELASVVAGWTDEELCWAWRCSFGRLQQAGDAAGLARIGQQRRIYLAEIERRDPRGFAAWLSDGARAASDPRRYLRLDR
jgi:hypothetical protein